MTATPPGAEDDVLDSPTGWVARHVRGYVETDGEKGELFYGAPALLLTTRGRTTGRWRRTALFYGRDGDHYVVVGSIGGAPKHPQWYLNLQRHPVVRVQVGAEKFSAMARTATPDEKGRLWPEMTKIWPEYERYQAKTDRDIPVVILEPTDE